MADFVAGWISGSSSIIVGNPLDVIKVRFQSQTHPRSTSAPSSSAVHIAAAPVAAGSFTVFTSFGSLLRGVGPPVVGYGGLNAILFYTYNRTLSVLQHNGFSSSPGPASPSLLHIWAAGAVGGLACFVVSTPTELIKCRAQIGNGERTTWAIAKDIWQHQGVKGLYLGGGVTSVRDAVGYGFYFWSYEGTKSLLNMKNETLATFIAGGIAGCATWASIYPLDLIKTRVQLQTTPLFEPLLPSNASVTSIAARSYSTIPSTRSSSISSTTTLQAYRMGAWEHTKVAYREGGVRVFFNGFWACMARAFVVNSVQWGVYEYLKSQWTPSST